MNYRSHAKEEVIEALKQGKKVFALDTGNYGEDDVLIGGTLEEALADVLSHHELAELPEGWEITEIMDLPGELERLVDVEKLIGIDAKVYANIPDDAIYTVFIGGAEKVVNLQDAQWEDLDDLATLIYDRL